MSRNQKTRNQSCTETSLDTWKSTMCVVGYVINRH